jgi:HTH-type transcriptional regulator/antitoxin HipB
MIFPLGNIAMTTASDIAATIKATRKTLGLRQEELAAAAGVGTRFLIELEAGKPTARLDKTLAVLGALGLDCVLTTRGGASPSKG